MTDSQFQVIAWWYGRRDYATGIALLSRYSKNKTIFHTLSKPGKERFISNIHKLNYELTKSVHLDWLHMPDDPSPDFKKQENIPSENSPEKMEEEKNNPADTSFQSQKEETQDDLNQYPKVIRRLKYESSTLYKKRSILHADLRKVGDTNTKENILFRKNILAEIKTVSKQLEFYYTFLDAYEAKGVVPEEETVWPAEKPAQPEAPKTLEELRKIKWSLHRDSSKDRFKLLYQQRTKAKKENPMPKGPKRDAIEKRLKLREERIEEINKQIDSFQNAN